jgi:phosphopantetheinyl transferase (holo-ACP synthase)
MVFQMIPKLKGAAVAPGYGPAEPRVLSMSMFGRRVVCGVLGTESPGAGESGERIKLRLARALWNRHGASACGSNAARIHHSFVLRTDRLGKPRLLVDAGENLSISFTRIPGRSWAALCQGAQVGIDVAEFREFDGAYPFHRAFHDDDRLHSTAAAAGTVQEAASLIWSAKEAAVKAVGVGFHLVDPLEVRVRVIFLDGQRSTMEVCLERKLEEKISEGSSAILVRAFRYRDGWISVALNLAPPSKTEWGAIGGIS